MVIHAILNIDPKILLAAQEIAIEGFTSVELTTEEIAQAFELAKQIFCPGCG